MKRKVCVATDSRAEYGILYWVIKELQDDPDIDLQIMTLGAHTSTEFGLTYKDIEADGFTVDCKLETTVSADSPAAINKSIGLAVTSVSDAIGWLKPDIIVILGDRYEMMATALAAFTYRLPIAHIHGGETTEGAIDEAFRHSISKMSLLHFTTTDNHRRRVLQLGEDPNHVFNYGAPAVDHMYRQKLMSKTELEASLEFSLEGPVAMVTYHPVTLEDSDPAWQTEQLLSALHKSPLRAVMTGVNADTSGRIINQMVQDFCKSHPERFKFVNNLGQHRYHSALKEFDLMVGNSSSGIIESGSFQLPVVNIGQRQKGRDRGPNVIDSDYQEAEISKAIEKALSSEFKDSLRETSNIYAGPEPGRSSILIKDKLKSVNLAPENLVKRFHDIV